MEENLFIFQLNMSQVLSTSLGEASWLSGVMSSMPRIYNQDMVSHDSWENKTHALFGRVLGAPCRQTNAHFQKEKDNNNTSVSKGKIKCDTA